MARFRRRIDLSKPMISSKISVAKTGVTIDSISKLPPARALVLKIYHQTKAAMVTDVTEFKVNGKKLYLSPSMDFIMEK